MTREQAIEARYRDEFHYGICTRHIGPRGGITVKMEQAYS